jgi:hypothetical protein
VRIAHADRSTVQDASKEKSIEGNTMTAQGKRT